MKNSAVFINVGRGAVVDEPALISALNQAVIRGAALDVFETEPLPADHPFYRMENVLLSPHCADHTTGWMELAVKPVHRKLRSFPQRTAAGIHRGQTGGLLDATHVRNNQLVRYSSRGRTHAPHRAAARQSSLRAPSMRWPAPASFSNAKTSSVAAPSRSEARPTSFCRFPRTICRAEWSPIHPAIMDKPSPSRPNRWVFRPPSSCPPTRPLPSSRPPVPMALELSPMIAPLKIAKPSRSASRKKPAPPSSLPTIIPGPSRARAPPLWNCSRKYPIWTRS